MSSNFIATSTIKDLFRDSLTSSLCVSVNIDTKIWVATGMLVEYLESFTDSVVVREKDKPIGIIGGRDIIENLVNTPNHEFFEESVQKIMDKRISEFTPDITYDEMIKMFIETKRAFGIIRNEFDDFSCISGKKVLEIAKRCITDVCISQIKRKKVMTFSQDETIFDIMKKMLKNGTRRLILQETNQFINDRIILEKISEDMNYLKNVENFQQIDAGQFKVLDCKVAEFDLTLPQAAETMLNAKNPYLMFNENVITPWDICEILAYPDISISY